MQSWTVYFLSVYRYAVHFWLISTSGIKLLCKCKVIPYCSSSDNEKCLKRCEVASNNAKSSCHRCLQPHLSKLDQQTYIPNKESFRDHETCRKRIMTRFFSWTSAHNIIMIKTFQSLLQIWTQWRRAAGYEMMLMVTSSCVCQFLSTSIDQQSLLSTTATWVGVNLCDMLKSMYRIPHHSTKYYTQMAFYCIDVAVVNSWLLYR